MFWDEAEETIRSYIETQWALSIYATSVKLIFENEVFDPFDTFIFVNIEGTLPEKGPYGSAGKQLYVEEGIIYIHCFAPSGDGKSAARKPAAALAATLELKTVADVIKLKGANPPSPADHSDVLIPNQQPRGNYYRVSSSVPFILIGPP